MYRVNFTLLNFFFFLSSFVVQFKDCSMVRGLFFFSIFLQISSSPQALFISFPSQIVKDLFSQLDCVCTFSSFAFSLAPLCCPYVTLHCFQFTLYSSMPRGFRSNFYISTCFSFWARLFYSTGFVEAHYQYIFNNHANSPDVIR